MVQASQGFRAFKHLLSRFGLACILFEDPTLGRVYILASDDKLPPEVAVSGGVRSVSLLVHLLSMSHCVSHLSLLDTFSRK